MMDTSLEAEQNDNLKYRSLPGWILIIAVATNFISIYLQLSEDYLANPGTGKLATFLWVLSVILAGCSAVLYTTPFKGINLARIKNFFDFSKPKKLIRRVQHAFQKFFSKQSFWSLPHILIIALLIRVIPIMVNGLYLDEWYMLTAAKMVLKGTMYSPFGFIGDNPSNIPAFPIALVLAIFRNPLLSVRLTGVFESLVTIVFVYLLLKNLLGTRAASVGALLLAFSAWDIHMSALGWNTVIINPMLVAITLYLLYKIYSNDYTFRTIFALAFFLAISIHLLYLAAMMVIPTLLVFLILFIRRKRNQIDLKLREYALFSVYLMVCLSPMLPKLVWHFDETLARHGAFLQQGLELSAESKSPVAYYFDQIALLYDDYTRGQNNFGVEGLWGITLDPIVQVLSILGIVLAIVQVIRKKSDSYWLIIILSWGILLLVPLVLFFRTTSVWRSYAIVPIVYLLTTFTLVQIAKLLKFLTEKYLYSTKGMYKFFLIVCLFLYLIFSYRWFNHFFDTYLTKSDGYETRICQYADDQIRKRVQAGSIIYIPEELCFPLITSLYDESQYQFIPIRAEEPKPNINPGSFLIVLNSNRYTGYFREDIQRIAEQLASEHDKELLSPPSTTQPVLYFIR
jgi:hypothetical protein